MSEDQHKRRRKGPWRSLKHLLRKNKWVIPATLLSIVVLLGVGLWMRSMVLSMAGNRVTASKQANVGSGYRNITYKGKEYRYNNRITSILYVGVDSQGVLKPNDSFLVAPNADSISLVVLDEYHKKMTIMGINRNTICKIHRYSVGGYDLGEFRDQLCLAYSYGESGPVSAWNLCNSVSGILYGIPVNDYVITNRSSLPEIMNVLGSVTVTVPDSDLAEKGFVEGEQVVIDASNVETFVRSRVLTVRDSNIHRMGRQKAFINATVDKIIDMIRDNPSAVWRKVQDVEYCMQTNITRSRYLDLTNVLSNVSYSEQNYYIPEGENILNSRHFAEFYPDEEKLLDKIVEVFYIER